eukprot:scpid77569/ scgid1251/ Protein Wnt-5a
MDSCYRLRSIVMAAVLGLLESGLSNAEFPYHTSAALATSGLRPIRRGDCKRLTGLTEGQFQWCKTHSVFMQPIVSGAKLGLAECQRRFSNRRWNCPTDQPEVFAKAIETANPEASFVHSIQSAGITLAIARTCSRGDALKFCQCDQTLTKNKAKDWTWGPCTDNYHKGKQYAKEFLDAGKNESSPISMVASFNHETGQTVVRQSMQLVCKCHGLTGTCAQKTCWYSLPKVQVIGKKVLNKYTRGLRVKWEAQTEQIKPYSALVTNVTDQLLYSTPSLDYCEANDGTGALGTAGRQCDPNKTGPGSCNHLCCARGYNERRRIEERKCNCKFLWCCRVVCSRCLTVNKHYTCR